MKDIYGIIFTLCEFLIGLAKNVEGYSGHLVCSRIELDLDNGVKVNYRKIQTTSDGKFNEMLADSKNIMVKGK